MKRFRRSIGMGSALTLLASATVFVGSGPASAAPAVTCGQTITQNTVLTADVGPCPGNGVIISASNIALNLNGHRLYGTADRTDNRIGIQLQGVSGVTVTGGQVDGFAAGVAIDGGSGNTVGHLKVVNNAGPPNVAFRTPSANYGDGIIIGSVTASSNNVVFDNQVIDNGIYDGIGVLSAASTGNKIDHNVVADNRVLATVAGGQQVVRDDGINLGAGGTGSNGTTISNNIIAHNGLNGIDACADFGNPCLTTHNVIVNNTIENNGTSRTELPSGVPASYGINISSIIPRPNQNFSPVTNDLIAGNLVIHNLGVGIYVSSQGNRIFNNIALGNALDRSVATFLFGYDLVDFSLVFYPPHTPCTTNVWRGNTYNKAVPACTTIGGHQVAP